MHPDRIVTFGTTATRALASFPEGEDKDTQSVHSTAPVFMPPIPRATLNPLSSSFNYGTALGEVHDHRTSASAPLPYVLSPHTTPAVSTVYGNITCADDVIRYLVRRGGWAPWREFIADFQIGGDYFEMRQWLKDRQKTDYSFCSQNSDWIRPVSYEYFGNFERVDEVLICFIIYH